MKSFKDFLSFIKGVQKGWSITNIDDKRNLVTYVNKKGNISVTFGKDSWIAANPKKQFDTIDSKTGLKNIDINSILKSLEN